MEVPTGHDDIKTCKEGVVCFRAMMCLAVVSVLWKTMACEVSLSILLLKSMMRRELGPIRVGAEVSPEAKYAEEYCNRDTVSECDAAWHMCMCTCDIGSHGDTLGVDSMWHETRGFSCSLERVR